VRQPGLIEFLKGVNMDEEKTTVTVMLSPDPEHGFEEGEWENDLYVRCPDGCVGIWMKGLDSFQTFFFHMEEHDDEGRR